MSRTWKASVIAGILAVLGPVEARAQLEANVHAGMIALDGPEELEVLAGARFGYRTTGGLGFGASLDRAQTTVEEIDTDLWLTSVDINYALPTVSNARIVAGAGLGAARFSPDEGDDETEFLVPITIAVYWLNKKEGPSWAWRFDVRDNIIFVRNDPDGDDSVDNNWEVSAGFSIFLGSRE